MVQNVLLITLGRTVKPKKLEMCVKTEFVVKDIELFVNMKTVQVDVSEERISCSYTMKQMKM